MGTTVTLSFPSHIDVGISQVIMDDEYWQHHIFLQGGTFPADMEKLYNYPFAFYTGVSRENLHPLYFSADVLNKLTQHPAIYSLGVAGEETIHPLDFFAGITRALEHNLVFVAGLAQDTLHPAEYSVGVLSIESLYPMEFMVAALNTEYNHPFYIAVPIEGNLLSRSHVWRR